MKLGEVPSWMRKGQDEDREEEDEAKSKNSIKILITNFRIDLLKISSHT